MPHKILKVRPKAGLKVPRPMSNRFLPGDKVSEVPADPYWMRRLKEGSIELAKAEKKKPKAKAKSKTEKENDGGES